MDDVCRLRRALLADGPFCKVESCDCETIHVSLGPITLRLRIDVVESVWSTLGEALATHAAGVSRRAHEARERLS